MISLFNCNVECNPGHFGINCMEKCPFPNYGEQCAQSCNCSLEDCNYATGCSLPNTESNGTTYFSEKIDKINQNRFYLRVGVYVFGGVLIVFVIIFMWIELHQRTKRRLDEQNMCDENVPAYDEIIISEENGGVFILENEHL
ncbi:platelet endothelial aggregation receptor 1-like [Saccostrea echinata]|uniref:platelet endothelial aggregation receptor 1-like n=1 Tax=Saccostrea echinata TaxID=191078 RepID=UPI002A83BA32|nr:platelet endothelial aggregation receptor 1-like [Saccostrea echinata]